MYLERHNRVLREVYNYVAGISGFDPLLKSQPIPCAKVLKNPRYKFLFEPVINVAISHCKPDLVFVDRKTKKVWVLELTVTNLNRFWQSWEDKRTKYQTLLRTLRKSTYPGYEIKLIPLVVGNKVK